ncbi:MAG: hypothetical protein KAT32_00685 [Candidatus Moranbacteria bacterium]|nr:hypothetical protein [Candidatus Moranbacteria bacterium]
MDVSNKEKWKSVWNIIIEPINSIIIISTLFLIAYSVFNKHQDDAFLSSMLNIIISVLAGIIGSRIKDKIDENKILNKGKGAIRSLELLASDIRDFQGDITGYCENENIKDDENEFYKNSLVEISRKLNGLRKLTINSVEDWGDLIPDANIQDQIKNIINKERKADKLVVERNNLKVEIKELKESSERESEESKRELVKRELELEKKEEKIRGIKEELDNERMKIDPFIGSVTLNNLNSESYEIWRGRNKGILASQVFSDSSNIEINSSGCIVNPNDIAKLDIN